MYVVTRQHIALRRGSRGVAFVAPGVPEFGFEQLFELAGVAGALFLLGDRFFDDANGALEEALVKRGRAHRKGWASPRRLQRRDRSMLRFGTNWFVPGGVVQRRPVLSRDACGSELGA